jgi:site-specific DNA recombinase
MRAYVVQKKNKYYYKCSIKGSCNNKSADVLHKIFASALEHFHMDFDKELLSLIKTQTIATFNQLTQAQRDEHQQLEILLSEIGKKLIRLEERYIQEEIEIDLYRKYNQKFKAEQKQIEEQLLNTGKKVSNLALSLLWFLLQIWAKIGFLPII